MLRDMRLEGALEGTAQAHRSNQHVPVPSFNDGGVGRPMQRSTHLRKLCTRAICEEDKEEYTTLPDDSLLEAYYQMTRGYCAELAEQKPNSRGLL